MNNSLLSKIVTTASLAVMLSATACACHGAGEENASAAPASSDPGLSVSVKEAAAGSLEQPEAESVKKSSQTAVSVSEGRPGAETALSDGEERFESKTEEGSVAYVMLNQILLDSQSPAAVICVGAISEDAGLSQELIKDVLRRSLVEEQYPFLNDIDAKHCIDAGGDYLYAIVPFSESGTLAVNEWIAENPGQGRSGKVLYRSDNSHPILLRAGSYMPTAEINAVAQKNTLSWRPRLYSEDRFRLAKDEDFTKGHGQDRSIYPHECFLKIAHKGFHTITGPSAWQTELTMNWDGTFEGSFGGMRNDLRNEEKYPNGTALVNRFQGRFMASGIDETDHCIPLKLLYLDSKDGAYGSETIVDGTRNVISKPYGLEAGEDWLLYLPGQPAAKMPKAFMEDNSWILGDVKDGKLPFYCLYNPKTKVAFKVEDGEQRK